MFDSLVTDFGEGALTGLTAMWEGLVAFLPNLAAALVILLLGYIVSRIASAVVRRLLAAVGIDRLSERTGVAGLLSRINVEKTASQILGRIVFWILMLTFLLSASESLGLDRLSETIDSLVQYLPRVLGAIFILAIGLFVAGFARDAVRAGAETIGARHAVVISQTTYVLLIVISAGLAIGQLELETQLLTIAVGVVMAAAGIAFALAFGFGAREAAANLLAGAYLRNSYPPGTKVTVDDVNGEVKSVDQLSTVLAVDENSEIIVPNATFLRWNVEVALPPLAADEDDDDADPVRDSRDDS